MVNAHYVIIDFRAKFFSKIQNQASDTSRSLPSFSSAPFLLRAVPSERLGQVYYPWCIYSIYNCANNGYVYLLNIRKFKKLNCYSNSLAMECRKSYTQYHVIDDQCKTMSWWFWESCDWLKDITSQWFSPSFQKLKARIIWACTTLYVLPCISLFLSVTAIIRYCLSIHSFLPMF